MQNINAQSYTKSNVKPNTKPNVEPNAAEKYRT